MAATTPGRFTPPSPRRRCCAWRSLSAATKGFVILPRRWMVERTFSWFGRNRRLAKDFENLAETLATFVYPGLHPARRQAARKGARGSAKGWDSRPSPGLARTTTLRRFRSFAAMAANWQDRPRADYRG